jgi:hypothetical protein
VSEEELVGFLRRSLNGIHHHDHPGQRPGALDGRVDAGAAIILGGIADDEAIKDGCAALVGIAVQQQAHGMAGMASLAVTRMCERERRSE